MRTSDFIDFISMVTPFHLDCSSPSDNEEKHQCYITITAVPPVEPCEDCSQLAILHAQSGKQNLMAFFAF